MSEKAKPTARQQEQQTSRKGTRASWKETANRTKGSTAGEKESSNLPDSQYSINASSGKRAAHCSIETSEREGKE